MMLLPLLDFTDICLRSTIQQQYTLVTAMMLFMSTLFLLTGANGNEVVPRDKEIIHRIECPDKGMMSGINYWGMVSLGQVEFICNSSKGQITIGPYGVGDESNSNGISGSLLCPEQHCISSFYGSITTNLNRLGIRCRHEDDIDSAGTVLGEFGLDIGTNFDYLSQSLGARLMSVIVQTRNMTISVFKSVYSNKTTLFKSNDFDNQPTSIHGVFDYKCTKTDYVECPDEGAITAINYTYSILEEGDRLNSITFICSSSHGLTNYGPYGTTGDFSVEAKCEDNHHISYIRGRAGEFINKIDIVCIKSGEALPTGKVDMSTTVGNKNCEPPFRTVVDQHFSNDSIKTITANDFDDECYATNGKRPLKMKVCTKTHVNAIQIIYDAVPVAFNCKPNHIELKDSVSPRNVGFDVLGYVVGSTCSSLEQKLCLSVEDSNIRSDSASTFISNSHTNDHVLEIGPTGGKWKGVGVEASAHGVINFGYYNNSMLTKTNTRSSEIDKIHSTTIKYQGPSACVLVGFRSRYEVDDRSAKILYRNICERGSVPPTEEILPIYSTFYGNVHFRDFHFSFANKKCTTNLRLCISRIKLDSSVFHQKRLREKLTTEVNRCFSLN
ncbi:uncharacterized protein LOC119070179 [Bradysia coprophila]|uniref:uncharacterized protein LOC119070179 n=1 Tax=Bradysia coprophila TaxID=38358 RepID=UPI00187DD329|nr:uncharacterized protein LOC119070179 [Bradysia coprophila]